MSATEDVIELSVRYSDCIARAERAEAEVTRLRAELASAMLHLEVLSGRQGSWVLK